MEITIIHNKKENKKGAGAQMKQKIHVWLDLSYNCISNFYIKL
jgi:hypothetical protein